MEVAIVTSTDASSYGVIRHYGQKLWNITTGSYIDASPAISVSQAIVASDDGVLYMIDVMSGAIVSTFSDMASSKSSSAIGHDGIYVGSSDGAVCKLASNI